MLVLLFSGDCVLKYLGLVTKLVGRSIAGFLVVRNTCQ